MPRRVGVHQFGKLVRVLLARLATAVGGGDGVWYDERFGLCGPILPVAPRGPEVLHDLTANADVDLKAHRMKRELEVFVYGDTADGWEYNPMSEEEELALYKMVSDFYQVVIRYVPWPVGA